jgi:hypothetical protein
MQSPCGARKRQSLGPLRPRTKWGLRPYISAGVCFLCNLFLIPSYLRTQDPYISDKDKLTKWDRHYGKQFVYVPLKKGVTNDTTFAPFQCNAVV